METNEIVDPIESNRANQITCESFVMEEEDQVEGGLLNLNTNVDVESTLTTKPKKLHKKGVVYLSKIPHQMTATKLMEVLSEYGQIGRIHLVPNEHVRKSAARIYSEGWVEFARRRDAKMVAATLNNQPVPAKRRNPWYGELWNMKYLPKFEWRYFKEEATYKNAKKKTKLNVEIELAKKEADKFVAEVQMRKMKKKFADNKTNKFERNIPLKEPEEKRPKLDNPSQVKFNDKTFLKNLFTGGGL